MTISAHERMKWIAKFKAGPDRIRLHAGGRIVMMFYGDEMISYDRVTKNLASGCDVVEEIALASGVVDQAEEAASLS
ncbi:hypothetical protein [Roseovarius halotolerans]|nr:hypothetical protein [Roseovarius halotolerans]